MFCSYVFASRLLCILPVCFMAFCPLIYLRSFIKKKKIGTSLCLLEMSDICCVFTQELMEKLKMPSDAQLMQIAIADLNNSSLPMEDHHRALQELLILVESIDNANGIVHFCIFSRAQMQCFFFLLSFSSVHYYFLSVYLVNLDYLKER